MSHSLGSGKLLAFSAIPKTGGVTLVHLLRRHFGISHFDCVDRYRPPGGNHHLAEDLRYDLRLHPWAKSIGGHGLKPFLDYEEYDDRLVWYTFLRDPIKRYVSQYRFEAAIGRAKEDMKTWMRTYPRDNFQVRWLAGEEDLEAAKDVVSRKMRAVGILERYDESLLIFRQRLGIADWDVVYGRPRNVTKDGGVTEELSETVQRLEDEIVQRNALDILLYEYVRAQIWPVQVADYGGSEKLQEDLSETFAPTGHRGMFRATQVWREGVNRAYRNLFYKPIVKLDRFTKRRRARAGENANRAGRSTQ